MEDRTENERAALLANLANKTANELLRLKPTEEELSLFFKRLQVVDASIKYPERPNSSQVASTTSEEQKVIEKTFVQKFTKGSDVRLHFKIELNHFANDDFTKILSFIAMSARNFYLYVAEKLNSKP